MTTLEDESAERIFEYNNDGQLIRYLRGFKEDANYALHAQIFYEFDDNNLIFSWFDNNTLNSIALQSQ